MAVRLGSYPARHKFGEITFSSAYRRSQLVQFDNMSTRWQQRTRGPTLGEAVGEILLSTQPRPLTQRLGQREAAVLF